MIDRVLKLLKRNGFLYSIYVTFFWLRLLDLVLRDGVAETLIWTVLWLTPIVALEPHLRSSLVTEFWMKRRELIVFETMLLSFLAIYLAFIKFVVYGALLAPLEVVLLLCIMVLYHMLEVIKKLPEREFMLIATGLTFFFAVVMKLIVILVS